MICENHITIGLLGQYFNAWNWFNVLVSGFFVILNSDRPVDLRDLQRFELIFLVRKKFLNEKGKDVENIILKIIYF